MVEKLRITDYAVLNKQAVEIADMMVRSPDCYTVYTITRGLSTTMASLPFSFHRINGSHIARNRRFLAADCSITPSFPLRKLLVFLIHIMDSNQSFLDKCFRDNEGNLVIAQFPNVPIIVYGVFAIASSFLSLQGNVKRAVDLMAFGALFTWAWLELFQGVNYFRRGLGLVVMIASIAIRLDFSGN